MNWIPFELLLYVNKDEFYQYTSDYGATFSLTETQNLIIGIEKLIAEIKIRDEKDMMCRKFDFYTLERYFNLQFSDSLGGVIGITVWIILGTLTNGEITGYERGFNFTASLREVEVFCSELKRQLQQLVS